MNSTTQNYYFSIIDLNDNEDEWPGNALAVGEVGIFTPPQSVPLTSEADSVKNMNQGIQKLSRLDLGLPENERTNSMAVLEIVRKYFKTERQALAIVSLLEGLSSEGTSLGEMNSSVASISRPSREQWIEMLEELRNENLFSFSIKPKRSIIIKKGEKYRNHY